MGWQDATLETRELVVPGQRFTVSTYDGWLRVLSMSAEAARGPCWARYLAQLLWEDEELFLQLDSHMRFVELWDLKARRQLLDCRRRSLKPMLCSYGRAYQHGTPFDATPGVTW